ncbi:hypothetical protein SAZ11_37995 [Streptomyces sp. FXJ1.4098]|nr:hypothetical protein [Streptomyces sp. FXJ1.4098]
MQRVELDEPGAQRPARPGGEVGQIAEVAHSPGACGQQRVQLDEEAVAARRGRRHPVGATIRVAVAERPSGAWACTVWRPRGSAEDAGPSTSGRQSSAAPCAPTAPSSGVTRSTVPSGSRSRGGRPGRTTTQGGSSRARSSRSCRSRAACTE